MTDQRINAEHACILIVDDHEDNVELLRARLESWGYETETATNGREALERVEASLKQCLRLGLMDASSHAEHSAIPLPADYDPVARASLLLSYIIGRWHRFVRSGFSRAPVEQADAQLRLILQ